MPGARRDVYSAQLGCRWPRRGLIGFSDSTQVFFFTVPVIGRGRQAKVAYEGNIVFVGLFTRGKLSFSLNRTVCDNVHLRLISEV
jgi:hypothetical protein